MKWDEFRDLLTGLSPDTALGRVVSVRAEDREEVLKSFTPELHRIRNEWKEKHTRYIKEHVSKESMNAQLESIKSAFLSMAGIGGG